MALNVRGKVDLDGSGFNRTLGGLKGQVRSWAGSVKGMIAGAFTVGAIAAFTSRVLDAGRRISGLAEQFGITSEEVQIFDATLKDANLSFENMESLMSKIAETRKAAAEGNMDLRQTFLDYGITLDDLVDPQLRNIDLVKRMAEAASNIKIDAASERALQLLLGEQGAKLIRVLQDLHEFEGISILSDGELEELSRANRELDEFKRKMTLLGGQAAGKFNAFVSPGTRKELFQEALGIRSDLASLGHPQAADQFIQSYMRLANGPRGGFGLGRASLSRLREVIETQRGQVERLRRHLSGFVPMEPGDPGFVPDFDMGGEEKKPLFEIDAARKAEKMAKEKEEKRKEADFSSLGADSLARIGGFTGASSNTQASQQQDLVNLTRRMADNIRDIKRVVEGGIGGG